VRLKFRSFLVILLVLFTGCASAPTASPNQKLRMSINREPQSLDPRSGGDVISSSLHFLLFEGLTRFNPDWTISLSIAESIEISKDRKTYIFHLRPAKWSDGSSVTAQDFEYAWKKVLDPKFAAPNAHLFFPIKNAEAAKKGLCSLKEVGVSALDDLTLKVELSRAIPYFLDLTSFAAFFPISSKKDLEDPQWMKKTGDHFICNGPFRLHSWDQNIRINLEKNPHYWNLSKIHLDNIYLPVIPDSMTALHLFECGELDLLQQTLSPLPNEPLQELFRKGLLNLSPSAGTQIISFNTEQFPFNHVKIRKAFGLAVDREAIVNNVLKIGGGPAFSVIPPVLKKGREEQLLPSCNQELAKQLFAEGLAECGIEAWQFPPLTFTFSSNDLNKKIAEALQQQWKEALGITVSLQAVEHISLIEKFNKKQYQFAQTLWLAQYNDQMNIFERFKYKENFKNYSSWENKRFQELLEKSQEETGEQRMTTLREAEKLFIEEMPVLPLYHLNAIFLKKPYVKNLDSPYSSDLCFAKIDHES
jgi:oligopeptide transport system substrate-binding protein